MAPSIQSLTKLVKELQEETCTLDPIYIAGPMTGIPGKNHHAFFKVEQWLCEAGFVDVHNPASFQLLATDEDTWENWMDMAVAEVISCHEAGEASMIMLPGWKHSKGASVERSMALYLPGFWKIYYMDN